MSWESNVGTEKPPMNDDGSSHANSRTDADIGRPAHNNLNTNINHNINHNTSTENHINNINNGINNNAEPNTDAQFRHPSDLDAIDAMFAERAGETIGTQAQSARVVRLEALLGLLDTPTTNTSTYANNANATNHDGKTHDEQSRNELLKSATLARIMRATNHSESPQITGTSASGRFGEAELSDPDRRAVDAMVDNGWDTSAAPENLRERCEKLAALANLLEPQTLAHTNNSNLNFNASTKPSASLRERTLRLIDNADRHTGEVYNADVAFEGRGGRSLSGRWRDLVAVAATLLIAVGVGWPMLAGMQDQHGRLNCRSNLMTAGFGFGQYANDHRDRLPMASASMPGLPWWQVGNPERSNSANLFTLVNRSYLNAEALTDPAYAEASSPNQFLPDAMDWPELRGVSYSFQNLFAAERPDWNGSARVAILSCRSPVVVRSVTGDRMTISVLMGNSMTHGFTASRDGTAGGAGQNVLFNDGAVQWLDTPVLESGDHLWLPAWVERALDDLVRFGQRSPLRGSESPESATDTFLAP